MSSSASNTSHTRIARRWSALCCLALFATGVGCSAEADIPEVVVTRTDVAFEGVPLIPGYTDVSQTLTTTFEHPSDFDLPSELNPELRPISASITGRGDLTDLSFLESMKLSILSHADDGPPPSIVAQYTRLRPTGVGRTIKLDTDVDSDILSYWDTEEAYYEVELTGIMPSEDWSIDVSFALSGRISISTSD